MDGLGRNEHRGLDRDVTLDTREEPVTQVIDQTESDDEAEPSFSRSGPCPLSSFS